MRIRVFTVLALVFGLVSVLVWGASAQGPEPTSHDGTTSWSDPVMPDGPVTPLGSNAAAVAVGQPGLSYRYVQTFGVTEQAYLGDAQHVFEPTGLFIDGSDNLYVVESRGRRMLKYNSSGSNLLSLGKAGLCYTADYVFCAPNDVAVDSGNNIWVADGSRVAEYTAAGVLMQTVPATNSSQQGTDNYHFKNVRGVGFDSAGRLYVSDGSNQRIQIYSFTGATPVYSTTIGVTGVPGNGNLHFNNPFRIVLDSSDQLYVTDSGNSRVQRCTFSGTWSCITFAGGLNSPLGIARDSSNNIFIADSLNGRVRKCDSGGTCSDFITGLTNQPGDVAIDSSGNAFVSERFAHRVSKYNSGGVRQGTFVGTDFVPYVVDSVRLNTPWGLAVAPDGSIYVAEIDGQRLLKLNAAGVQQWAVGQGGVIGTDNAHFDTLFGVALDSNGRVYVADCNNNRVQIFTPNGSYVGTLGSFGSGNSQFNCPTGLFITPNNTLYVADGNNQRVQIFDSNQLYIGTMGVTGASGSDNAHFNWPQDIAVDSNGAIYVSDKNNRRIQVFDSGRVYQRTIGSPVSCTGRAAYDEICSPTKIAVDAAGNLHVADGAFNRVQVFDPSGAYLTTIGGSWGVLSGQLRTPVGVALDKSGNLYVSEWTNHRIQKYAPGVPGWRQSNINGFGDHENRIVSTLAPFGGQLYAGTYNTSGNGAQIWRSGDGTSWTPVISNGFGITRNIAINHLLEFNGKLYAATLADTVNGGELWRSGDGLSWTRVVTAGFGDPTNAQIHYLAVFNNQLYASTWSYTGSHGAEVWRSSTGDSGDWTRVVSNGFNSNAHNQAVTVMQVFSGALYAGTENNFTGTEIWASSTGNSGDWIPVSTAGFGEGAKDEGMTGMAEFNGRLYAGVGDCTLGAEVWRSSDGTAWTKVVDAGLGDPKNCSMDNMLTLNSNLYLTTNNAQKGIQVWRTADGTTWNQINPDGFGDSNTVSGYWDNSVTVFNGHLFIGTYNFPSGGGRIWQMLQNLYLPLIER